MKMKQQDFKINFKLVRLYLSKLVSNLCIPSSDGGIMTNHNFFYPHHTHTNSISPVQHQYNYFHYVWFSDTVHFTSFLMFTLVQNTFLVFLLIWVQLCTLQFFHRGCLKELALFLQTFPNTKARTWCVSIKPLALHIKHPAKAFLVRVQNPGAIEEKADTKATHRKPK